MESKPQDEARHVCVLVDYKPLFALLISDHNSNKQQQLIQQRPECVSGTGQTASPGCVLNSPSTSETALPPWYQSSSGKTCQTSTWWSVLDQGWICLFLGKPPFFCHVQNWKKAKEQESTELHLQVESTCKVPSPLPLVACTCCWCFSELPL